MKRWIHRVTLAVLITLAVGVTIAHAASSIVLPRAGQVGLGLQVQAGTLLKSGGLGEEFGSGPGMAVRLRYRMRFERAIGLSFDVQRLKSRNPTDKAGAFDDLGNQPGIARLVRERLKMVTAGIELYQLFDTRDRTIKMLSAGAGLAQISARLNDGETQFPIAGDGVYLSLGAGIERFTYRSIAWDLSTRYMTVLQDKKVNHDIQLSLGFIFYAAY